MGNVGKFFLGGSDSKQKGQNQSQSSSENSSQNSSSQVNASRASNFQNSGSTGYNQAYAPVAAAMTPALGYTTQAGDAMASLLGLEPSNFSYNQQPYSPPDNLLPAAPTQSSGSLKDIVTDVISGIPSDPAAHTPTPTPAPSPAPSQSNPTSTREPLVSSLLGGRMGGRWNDVVQMEAREMGGPVEAGKPYVVGEKRPEVFVPNQSGTIIPQVPGTVQTQGVQGQRVAPAGGTALNNFSNSGGMDFILDQGQKAVSGASAANGVFNSGATGKALVNYGQGVGKNYLQQYMGNLMNLGQLGLGAGSSMTGAGSVNQAQSQGGGSSMTGGAGFTQGTSTGFSDSTSSGTTSGKSNQKNGLLPALASFVPKPGG